MSSAAVFRWVGDSLVPLDYCDPAESRVEAADSWLVDDGRAFAPALHRERFLAAAEERGRGLEGFDASALERFWNAALDSIPTTGRWFPRVELQSRAGAAVLVFRERTAPPAGRSLVLADYAGADPRRVPHVKGPDLAALVAVRSAAQSVGADEGVLRTPEGYIIEGGTTSLVWWRGDILVAPPEGPEWPDFDRVPSVTARTLFGLAGALGVETHREPVTPSELEGTEVWALNALHGIRIVTEWRGAGWSGPERNAGLQLAELPGRLALWRDRRAALLHPLEGARA